MARLPAAAARGEAALSACWAAGLTGHLRLEDGRSLRVIFPGIPGGPAGPDYRDAIVEAGGDLLRGDVELHPRTSGWREHGHHVDPAYRDVVLHVVTENDARTTATRHTSGRSIPILALPPRPRGQAPAYVPPCSTSHSRGISPGLALERLGLERFRMKAARLAPPVSQDGPGAVLYRLTLASLAGPANRAAFAELADRLPLDALLDRITGQPDRALAIATELKAIASRLVMQRCALRPQARPGLRLEGAGRLLARWWPDDRPGWPRSLAPGSGWRAASCPGIGRATAVEIMVNAVLPVAFTSGAWPQAAAEDAFRALPSPGTYGILRPLESALGAGGTPFTSASRLQGGLLLHADYCARGLCGSCPLSDAGS